MKSLPCLASLLEAALVGMGSVVALSVIFCGLWLVMRWEIRSQAEEEFPTAEARKNARIAREIKQRRDGQ